MKLENNYNLNSYNFLYSLVIVLTLLICTADRSVQAQSKSKESDKLEKKMTQVSGSDFIDVIITPKGGWSSGLTNELNNKGALKKKSFTNFSFQVFKVKRSDIDNIASRADVDFIALDDTVKTLGHMTNTTGANAVRNINGNSNPLNGTGVGIVIVDSGIDPNHVSFKDDSGNSRIVYNQDFTGENRTTDPYGHGTHVASIAAGNNSVSNGAYEGVAPNAKLINLRVLIRFGVNFGFACSIKAAAPETAGVAIEVPDKYI
jgi:subtilisin family serine protease